ARLGSAPQGALGADGAAVRRLSHGRDRPGVGAHGARARGRDRVTRLAVRASWLAVYAATFLWRWLTGPAEPSANGRAGHPRASAGAACADAAAAAPASNGRQAPERAGPASGPNGAAGPGQAEPVVAGARGPTSATRSLHELQLPVGTLVPISLLLAVAAQFSGATAQALVLYGGAVAAF